jgi:ABC-type sugar transport system permease subunit
VELAHLRIISAFRQNLAVGILLPVWGIIGVIEFWFNPPQLAPGSKLINVLTWFSLILVIIFGILRNIPGFEFLLPTV